MTPADVPPPDYWSELPGTGPDPAARAELPRRPSTGPSHADWGDEPCYVISIAARMVGMHAQTLRYYERAGLVAPARSRGNIRLYRRSDIHRLRLIQKLIADHGVNLAGVELILRMEDQIRGLQERVESLVGEVRPLTNDGGENP
jgi:MerR family transcriptional regulator/heat shock protein HspR